MDIKLFDGKKASGNLFTIHPENGSIILKNFEVEGEDEIQSTCILNSDDFIYALSKNINPEIDNANKLDLQISNSIFLIILQ